MDSKTIRKRFVEYFRLLTNPSTYAARTHGLFNLGCEVDGALLLSLWFDEIWDFASVPPSIAETFTSAELAALNEFHQFISRVEPTLTNCNSINMISDDPSWEPVILEANKILELLTNDYEKLLLQAAIEFDVFSLVWRDQLDFNHEAKAVENHLKPHLIVEIRTDEWPGTKLFGSEAILRKYRVNPESLEILWSVSDVFEWRAPSYPEDLCFYKNEKAVFISVAHEQDSWFVSAQ